MKNETKAFPSEVIDDNAGIWDVKEGMDLRDYFASKAMLAEVLIDTEMENDYKSEPYADYAVIKIRRK